MNGLNLRSLGAGRTQVLGFALGEVREARLVPVLDFKKGVAKRTAAAVSAADAGARHGGHEE